MDASSSGRAVNMNFFFLIFEDTHVKISVDNPTGWCAKVCTVRCCSKFINMFLLDSVIFMLVQLFYQFSFFTLDLAFVLSRICALSVHDTIQQLSTVLINDLCGPESYFNFVRFTKTNDNASPALQINLPGWPFVFSF